MVFSLSDTASILDLATADPGRSRSCWVLCGLLPPCCHLVTEPAPARSKDVITKRMTLVACTACLLAGAGCGGTPTTETPAQSDRTVDLAGCGKRIVSLPVRPARGGSRTTSAVRVQVIGRRGDRCVIDLYSYTRTNSSSRPNHFARSRCLVPATNGSARLSVNGGRPAGLEIPSIRKYCRITVIT